MTKSKIHDKYVLKNPLKIREDAHTHMHTDRDTHAHIWGDFRERHTGNGTVAASREGTWRPREKKFLFTANFLVQLELFFYHEDVLLF